MRAEATLSTSATRWSCFARGTVWPLSHLVTVVRETPTSAASLVADNPARSLCSRRVSGPSASVTDSCPRTWASRCWVTALGVLRPPSQAATRVPSATPTSRASSAWVRPAASRARRRCSGDSMAVSLEPSPLRAWHAADPSPCFRNHYNVDAPYGMPQSIHYGIVYVQPLYAIRRGMRHAIVHRHGDAPTVASERDPSSFASVPCRHMACHAAMPWCFRMASHTIAAVCVLWRSCRRVACVAMLFAFRFAIWHM